MEQQSKNQCLLSKKEKKQRNESQSFFVLWKYFMFISKLMDSISLNSEMGKMLLNDLKKIGRQKVKRRGKLFVLHENKAKTIGDLFINRGNGIVNIPFYLIMMMKEIFKKYNNDKNIKLINEHIEKIIETAYLVAQENSLIIDIVYRKMLTKYRNIYMFKEDIITEGFLGLMHAVYSYTPEKKVKFETYAYNWCWKYMFEYVKKYVFESISYEYNDKISIIGKKSGGKKQVL